ncbi:Phosphinothricin acetyltransferase [Cellulomonas flavigena DSM 20109]|uniref:Phosphinothricin acetyltransferase n=1 Tax=Cellulomonas flavigena (strain ATCC 482 / DSM 20109 / BCRC 11376 / JCM 18109 / NBRC 3775 / NCIMB 8073 / NRS 134) TaxID=446466 RepID=D5UHA0_CELFN|nr:GNAT family N-acetyltransferase [Cellulomonas flavigena]ADG73303.1 Phosphinothricin acetyltransferase [Cellulomonas flavigena DSM 20109]
MSVQVRAAADGDVAAVARIYDHYVATSTATFELEPPGEPVWRGRLDTLTAAGWPFQVAVLDGQVAGFAYVGPWRPRPAYAHTVEDTIYLDPAATGRGVGTRLLTSVLDAAGAAGAREVIAVVADGDTAASLALHRRAGFHTAGRLERVGRKFDRWLGTTLLQKTLGQETLPGS